MNHTASDQALIQTGQAHGAWKVVRIGLFGLALILAGCDRTEPPAVSSATDTPVKVPSPEPALSANEQQWHAWFEHCSTVRLIGESATNAKAARDALESALGACRSYSREAPASDTKLQVHDWIEDAQGWIRFFTAVYEIESALEVDEFDKAREWLSSARQIMHEREVQKFTQLIDSREAELMRDWIPTTVDMPGYTPGSCYVGRNARNLDDVERVMQERRWLRVIGIHRTSEHIAIDHFDGLLQMRGTLTFYKDMATCKAMRGE